MNETGLASRLEGVGEGLGKGGEGERLLHEAGDAELAAFFQILGVVRRGHDDDGDMLDSLVGPDGLKELQAAELGQLQIEKQGGEVFGRVAFVGEEGEGFRPVVDSFDVLVEFGFFELAHQEGLVIGIIFDDQDARVCFHGNIFFGGGIDSGFTFARQWQITCHYRIELGRIQL